MDRVITQNKIKSHLGKFRFIFHRHDFVQGCFLTILVYEHQHNKSLRSYLIGYEVANALNKKTFNLYRSLRNRGIVLDLLSKMKTKELIFHGILEKRTNTVTLIPFFEGCDYLSTCKMDEIDKAANVLVGMSQSFSAY